MYGSTDSLGIERVYVVCGFIDCELKELFHVGRLTLGVEEVISCGLTNSVS